MKRSWSVQYKTRGRSNSQHQASSQKHESIRLSSSINCSRPNKVRTPDAYDATTDKGIFALGDAALDAGFDLSKLDGQSDLFKEFDDILKGISKDNFKISKDGDQIVAVSPDYSREKGGTVAVRTVCSTPEGGQRVQTKVLQQGPVKKLTRIKVTRLPNDDSGDQSKNETKTIDVPFGTDLGSLDGETLKELLKFSEVDKEKSEKPEDDQLKSESKSSVTLSDSATPLIKISEEGSDHEVNFMTSDEDIESENDPKSPTHLELPKLNQPIQPIKYVTPAIVFPGPSQVFQEEYGCSCLPRKKTRLKSLHTTAKAMAVAEVDSSQADAFTGINLSIIDSARVLRERRRGRKKKKRTKKEMNEERMKKKDGRKETGQW